MRLATYPSQFRQRGFGLVEIMVGLLIGFIAVLVIYQVYSVSEGFKRNTTAAGEAQQTGLFSAFVLGIELANAGNGFMVSPALGELPKLISCPDPGGAMPLRFAQSWRPLSVVAADSGTASTPDNFVVSYSTATTLALTAQFMNSPPAGGAFSVLSPGGFHGKRAAVNLPGDLVVGINPAGPQCATSRITDNDPLVPDGNGIVTFDQAPVDPAGGVAFTTDSFLLNLGPCDRVQKVMYSLAFMNDAPGNPTKWDYHPACSPTKPCVLYSTPLLDTQGNNCGKPANPFIANPLASNVVNMKIEYGIDTDKDAKQDLDTWVLASGDWSWDTLMTPSGDNAGDLAKIDQIKAVRIGIIVQSEQFDQTLGDYNWVLFDCSAHDNTCPGRLTGQIAAQTNPKGNWRYRKYETVIPMRNAIYNRY